MLVLTINVRPFIQMWTLQPGTVCILWIIPGRCLELARRKNANEAQEGSVTKGGLWGLGILTC